MNQKWMAVLLVVGLSSGCGEKEEQRPDPDAGGEGEGEGEGEACAAPTSGPTEHGSNIASDETWTADTGPHIVPADTTVAAGATLTIERCAEVRIGAIHGITVRGHLVAAGTADGPVLITADGDEPWTAIRNYGGDSSISLTYTTVEKGGDPGNSANPDQFGMIMLQGDVTQPVQGLLHVDHATVRDSGSNGILLFDAAAFTAESTALTVSGAAQFPVSAWTIALGTLPDGTYTGNASDEILAPGGGGAQAIARDLTLHDPGVPYRIGTSVSETNIIVDAGSAGLATLTIEPGVHIRFGAEGTLWVERAAGAVPSNGAIVAVGTEEDPIVLTSAAASPAAGDWLGVYFGSEPDPSSRIEHVRVEYAGAVSGFGSESCIDQQGSNNDAAIRIGGGDAPTQFINHTTIVASANHGIDRGWTGDLVDFLDTNTFEDIARCRQTLPHPDGGSCPDPVPCD